MTQEMRQLEQMQALTASRGRVTEVLLMMAPLVERLADEGDPLARYLLDELDKAQDVLKLANMDAYTYLEESNG